MRVNVAKTAAQRSFALHVVIEMCHFIFRAVFKNTFIFSARIRKSELQRCYSRESGNLTSVWKILNSRAYSAGAKPPGCEGRVRSRMTQLSNITEVLQNAVKKSLHF